MMNVSLVAPARMNALLNVSMKGTYMLSMRIYVLIAVLAQMFAPLMLLIPKKHNSKRESGIYPALPFF
jgi:hypothetical protein